MAKQKGSGKFMSVAFMMSAIGLLAICTLSFYGFEIYGITRIGAALASGGLFCVGLEGMAYAIKAKGATNDFKKWKIVEIVAVVAMLVVIVGSAPFVIAGYNYLSGPQKALGKRAVLSVDAMVGRYVEVQNDRLDATVAGLSNFAAHQVKYAGNIVQRYISREVLGGSRATMLNNHRIEDFYFRTKEYIENGSNEVNRIAYKRELINGFKRRVNRWRAYDIKPLADSMRGFADTLAVELGDMAQSVRLPLIQASGSSYELVETEPPVFSTPADIIQLQLEIAGIKDIDGRSLLAVLLLAALFLFNYFMSMRSLAAPVGRGPKISDKYGFPL